MGTEGDSLYQNNGWSNILPQINTSPSKQGLTSPSRQINKDVKVLTKILCRLIPATKLLSGLTKAQKHKIIPGVKPSKQNIGAPYKIMGIGYKTPQLK